MTTPEPLTLLVGTFRWACYLPALPASSTAIGTPVQAIGSGFGLVPFLRQVSFNFRMVGPV